MKRPLTLIGFILGTVMHSIYTVAELFLIALIIDLIVSAGATTSVFTAVILLITVALSIVSLIFNAIAISAWNKSPEGYRKKRGIIITAIVFNFIVVFFLVIGMTSGSVGVLDILLMLSIIAANVLAFVDLGREKRRVARLQEKQVITEETEIVETQEPVEEQVSVEEE